MTNESNQYPGWHPDQSLCFLEALLDRAEHMIVALDPEVRFCIFNNHGTSITGHTRNEVLGKAPGALLSSPKDEQSLIDLLRQTEATESALDLGSQWQCADGSITHITLSWSSVRDAHGKLICYLGLATDESQQLRSIVESAIEGVLTIDQEGMVLTFNAAAERIFGYRREEVIGNNIELLLTPFKIDQHGRTLTGFSGTEPAPGSSNPHTVSGRHKNGTDIPIRLALTECEALGRTLSASFLQDLSELEEARNEAAYYLEKLAHLNRIDAMGGQASSLAHELRQPLMAIQGFAAAAQTALKKETRAVPDSPVESALEEIARQSTYASEIIKEVSDYLKRSQRPTKEPTDVISITRNVMTLLSHELRMAGIRFELETETPPCVCHVNRIQLEQVIYNLISNAIDSLRSIEGPRILQLSCRRQEDGAQCVITVRDNGPGLPHKNVEQLCEPGFTTKPQGLGYGLSICRSILEHHGGELQAGQAEDGGAVFRFTLPLTSDIS